MSTMEPVKPDGPKPNSGRPGGCMKKSKVVADNGGSGGNVTMTEGEFNELLNKLRKNELLGPAAADALEVAAGLKSKDDIDDGSPRATKLRKEVANSREEPEAVPEKKEKKKKKGAGFAFAEPEEIPEVKYEAPPEPEEAPEEEKAAEPEEPPELNLTPKQNKMRTDLEMWLMDEVPPLYGVDDSEELEEDLQEDGQAAKATELIAAGTTEKCQPILDKWLKDAPDADKKEEFCTELLGKVTAIVEAGPKKKKKKKKAAE